MKGVPERKFLRPDTSIDQRTFNDRGEEISIDDIDVHSIWSDVLSLGEQFRRNIADAMLGTSMQPRRGEILVTRDGTTQETRAVPYRARRHERPTIALSHEETADTLPREQERRSLRTARHSRHSRAHFASPAEHPQTKNHKLSAGGFITNLGREYKLLAWMEERVAAYQKQEADRRNAHIPTDDIPF